MGANMAIIKAGRVNTNFTRNSAFVTSEKAITIWGNAGEIVMTDIIVRLLTRRRVSFNFHFLFSIDSAFLSEIISTCSAILTGKLFTPK